MSKLKSLKIRLEANNKQTTMFKKHAGCARYAYNWALEMSDTIYKDNGKTLSAYDLTKVFVRLEKSQHEWLTEVGKCCTQNAILDFGVAQKRFFKSIAKFPKKKKKNKSRDSFYLEKDGVKYLEFNENKIKLPKIGWVKLSEKIPEGVQIKNCVISRHADQWFISFKTEFEPTTHKNQVRVGVDFGIKMLATCSSGLCFETPKKLKQLQKKLKQAQKKLNRQYETWKIRSAAWKEDDANVEKTKLLMSENFKRQKEKIAKLHKQIVDHRKDSLHKCTTALVKANSELVIEDLNVSGMVKNHNLASSIANGSFGEMRRQLEYKGEWYGCKIIVANRFFPSSKICSCCGEINKELTLKDRNWTCKSCGEEHDRDINAAINLRDYPEKWAHIYDKKEKHSVKNYATSFVVKACGERSSADSQEPFSLSEKQETNTEFALIGRFG